MADDLFLGLPPPSSAPAPAAVEQRDAISTKKESSPAPAPAPAPAPLLKSALKRDKPPETPVEGASRSFCHFITGLRFACVRVPLCSSSAEFPAQ